jgi:hypothetical protein
VFAPRSIGPQGPEIHEIIQILVDSLMGRFEESPYSWRMPNTRFDNLRQFKSEILFGPCRTCALPHPHYLKNGAMGILPYVRKAILRL